MSTNILPTRVLTTLGLLTATYFVQRSASFVWFYYLRPSSIHKFLHGKEPYALITGASDGIGRAIAQELYEKGFNLILHGRNETKLKGVIEQIHAGAKDAKRDIRYFIAPADAPDVDFKKIAEQFKDLRITLFINNVGGGRVRSQRYIYQYHHIYDCADCDLVGLMLMAKRNYMETSDLMLYSPSTSPMVSFHSCEPQEVLWKSSLSALDPLTSPYLV